MSQVPLVSVLMPAYNAERDIGKAIESIQKQTFADFEFIIVDDGSTDETAHLVRVYTDRDKRIVFVQNERNRGLIYSLNKGLQLARGTYIARQDADDVSLPERLSKQVRFLANESQIAILGTWVANVDAQGQILNRHRFPTSPALIRWQLLFENCIAHPSVMMRRAIVQEMGGYAHDKLHAEDYDLWSRISQRYQLANLPETLMQLYWSEQGVSKKFAKLQSQTARRIKQAHASQLLGLHSIPEEQIMALEQTWRGQPLKNATEIERAATLLQTLYEAYLEVVPLSHEEEALLKKDMASKLFILAGNNPRVSLWMSIRLMALGLRLDFRLPALDTVLRLVGKA